MISKITLVFKILSLYFLYVLNFLEICLQLATYIQLDKEGYIVLLG